jgi:hypothetical protein
MASKFKKGDRVRAIENCSVGLFWIGDEGKVVDEYGGPLGPEVLFDGAQVAVYARDTEIELIKEGWTGLIKEGEMERGKEAYKELIKRVEEIDSEAAQYLRKEAYNVSGFRECGDLNYVMIWNKTPQRHAYWSKIYYQLSEGGKKMKEKKYQKEIYARHSCPTNDDPSMNIYFNKDSLQNRDGRYAVYKLDGYVEVETETNVKVRRVK